MAASWWDRLRRRPVDPFTKHSRRELDLVMSPRYDMTEAVRAEWTTEVDAYLAQLMPNAVDAYSREVLDD